MIKKAMRYLQSRFEGKAAVLLYHRIEEVEFDPWQLCVSQQYFEAHLQFLKKRYKVIPLEELGEALNKRKLPRNVVCLTFDDGYRDNFEKVAPILVNNNCPATFFIPTYNIESQQPFWWDLLGEILLCSNIKPQHIEIKHKGTIFNFLFTDLGTDSFEYLAKSKRWNYLIPPPNQICQLYLELWSWLRTYTVPEINDIMNKLQIVFNYYPEYWTSPMPMNWDQLKMVKASNLITIGLHTHTHPVLGFQPRSIQESEIINGDQMLKKNDLSPLSALAYPMGNYNLNTLEIVKLSGIKMGLTTEPQLVTNLSETHRIGRFQILNWNKKEFSNHINTWLN